MKQYLLNAFFEHPWAILPQKLAVLESVVIRHIEGEKMDAEEVQAAIHGAARPVERQVSGVAVLPLFGTIFPRANLMTSMSGATSAERFGAQFDELMNSPQVSAIVLDVNSPGGQVSGVEELSQKIYNARGKKPVVAVVNHMMASAAYWIGTAADEVVMSPSSETGSIGVFAAHQDYSKAVENDGVKVSLISAGKYKVEGNPYEPLSEEARANIQARVDENYKNFLEAIALHRGVSVTTVRNDFGEGRMLTAKQAVAVGMADRIGTLEDTVKTLLEKGNTPLASAPRADATEQNVTVSVEDPASSTEPEAEGETAHEAQRLRDFLDVYYIKE